MTAKIKGTESNQASVSQISATQKLASNEKMVDGMRVKMVDKEVNSIPKDHDGRGRILDVVA